MSDIKNVLNATMNTSGLLDQTDFLISTIENRPVSPLSIVFAILFSFTFVFGIFTNLIVVLVFAIKSEFRQYTNYFFANLSIADILVLIVCIPVAITDLFSPDIWNYGALYCKIYFFIEYCVTSVSSLTIIIISIERFFAIASPWTVKQLFNERKSKAAIVFVWAFGLTISLPFISMVEYTTHPTQCYLNMTKLHIIYVCVLNIMLIFVPTVGLAFLYTYIIIKLKDHYKLFVSSSPPRQNSVIAGAGGTNSPPRAMSNPNDVLRVHRNNNRKTSHNCPAQLKASLSNKNDNKVNTEVVRACSICFAGEGKRFECRCASKTDADVSATAGTKPPATVSHSFHHIQRPLANAISLVAAVSHSKASLDLRPNLRRSINKNQNLNTSKFNFTIVISFVTLAFFFCQLPCRIFLLWSYLTHYFSPPLIEMSETGEEPPSVKHNLFFINLVSNFSTLIYFLHCISNPIIYNILSIKFRKAFLSLTTFNKSRDCRISFKIN